MELNERIMLLRKQAGLTQEQLGEKLGVSRQAVSKWEAGQANPDVVYITELCRLFDVSSDWLLLGEEKGVPGNTAYCTGCGAPTPAFADYCPKCGKSLSAQNDYLLYLKGHDDFSWGLTHKIAALFAQDWARPAFHWNDTPSDKDAAWNILRNVPLILCEGLTREQAAEGRTLFGDYAHLVEIYRKRDMVESAPGVYKPEVEPVDAPAAAPQPLSGGAIFGLVVLGVIVAIVIMSIF